MHPIKMSAFTGDVIHIEEIYVFMYRRYRILLRGKSPPLTQNIVLDRYPGVIDFLHEHTVEVVSIAKLLQRT